LKNIATIIVALALIPAISSAAQDTVAMNTMASADTSAGMAGGKVYVVKGDVFVAQGNNPSHRVTDNEAIASNTLVNTGKDSSALLKFEDGQVVAMQSGSTFLVREYRYDAKKIANSNIVFSMLKGGMRFVTGLIGKLRKQSFRLSTPNSTIGIRGTEFMLVMTDRPMYGQVIKGRITMTNAAGMKVVGAGKSVVVKSPKVLASLVSASAVPAGTFSELLSIPVDPSAIPAPAPAPEAAAPAPEAPAETGEAAVGAMPGMTESSSEPAQAEAPAAEASPAEAPPEPAKQAEATEMASSRSGAGVVGKVGTLGYGVELVVGLTDSFSARIGYNDSFNSSYTYNATEGSVNYDLNLEPRTVSVLGDWYPFEGGFRASGGLMYNDNQITMNGLPTGGNYVINGQTYSSVEIGDVQGAVTFANFAPYIGIGWGNPVQKDKGWGVVMDVGALYQGSPKINLTATCKLGAGNCGTLPNDLEQESRSLESDLSRYKWWPVASIGISYQW
jgi:hypothetical protein